MRWLRRTGLDYYGQAYETCGHYTGIDDCSSGGGRGSGGGRASRLGGAAESRGTSRHRQRGRFGSNAEDEVTDHEGGVASSQGAVEGGRTAET